MIPFALGMLIGFVFFSISAVVSRKIVLVKLGGNDRCFHIHHFMILLPLMALSLTLMVALKKYANILQGIAGFCLGGSLTNLLYPDWNIFIRSCIEDNECHVPLPNSWIGEKLKKLC